MSKVLEQMLMPKAHVIFDLLPIAFYLQHKAGNLFLSPRPGIYREFDLEPFLDIASYYEVANTNSSIQVKGFDLVNSAIMGDVYTTYGRPIMKHHEFRQLKTKLTTNPVGPIVQMKFLIELIENELDYLCKFERRTNVIERIENNNFRRFFTDQGFEIFDHGGLDRIYRQLLDDVDFFVGSDNYNIYSLDVKPPRVVIEKCEDFRIYDWTRRKEIGGFCEPKFTDEEEPSY